MSFCLHPGESPSSSSASDVDNLNKHHGIVPGNKTSLGKAAIVSPQIPSGASGVTSLNIPARLRPVATRFLRDVCPLISLSLGAFCNFFDCLSICHCLLLQLLLD